MVLFDKPNHFSFIQSENWCEPNPHSISKSTEKPNSSSFSAVFDLTFNGINVVWVECSTKSVDGLKNEHSYSVRLASGHILYRCYCLNQFLTASVVFGGTKMLVYWILFFFVIKNRTACL